MEIRTTVFGKQSFYLFAIIMQKILKNALYTHSCADYLRLRQARHRLGVSNCRLLPESQKRAYHRRAGSGEPSEVSPLEALWEIGRACRLESSRAGARLSFEPHNIACRLWVNSEVE